MLPRRPRAQKLRAQPALGVGSEPAARGTKDTPCRIHDREDLRFANPKRIGPSTATRERRPCSSSGNWSPSSTSRTGRNHHGESAAHLRASRGAAPATSSTPAGSNSCQPKNTTHWEMLDAERIHRVAGESANLVQIIAERLHVIAEAPAGCNRGQRPRWPSSTEQHPPTRALADRRRTRLLRAVVGPRTSSHA